ncbi:PKD repeat protein [Methanolinea mesophila]|uniref:DUF7948 domain-containing protein n=1 Tax=Methanolinea mesophila TaxID=547055 RepID=UPI001AE5E5FA|nr:PQQ-binding-like beta-propeller repeat protein [Methanolinea mesophila]MBP1928148.1 PKD repeat protein [Methanolinea mesophila]
MTKKATKIPAILILAVFALTFSAAGPAMAGLVLPEEQVQGIQSDTMFLPLLFIQNQGQAPDDVKYHASAAGHTISFMPDRIVLRAIVNEGETPRDTEISMSFPGASAAPEITGLDPQPGDANFYLDNDPSRWREGVPIFGSIEYCQLYPGIDLRYRGTEGVLKREFIVAPGADPDRIAIAYDGIQGLALNEDGSLAITTPLGVLTEEAPIAYQDVDGSRVPVSVSYRLINDRTVGFTIGEYDPSLPLVIDPTLIYSSFFGASGSTYIHRVRVDGNDNIWIAGRTSANDLPVQNPNQGYVSGNDGFVAELNPQGTSVLYLTYIGGGAEDSIQGLDLDTSGNVYICGATSSDNFPLQSPIMDTRNAQSAGFVTKLDPTGLPGSQLIYSTYLGHNGTSPSYNYTTVNAIGADTSGNAWISGYTMSETLPVTPDAEQPNKAGGCDSFVGKIAADGSLQYLTYLGGSADDGDSSAAAGYSSFKPMGLGLDSAGNVYIAGYTKSSDFPVVNAYDSTYGGGTTADIFVAKYNSSGGKVYATYIGGSNLDKANDIAVDAGGSVYIAGTTYSNDIPVINPAQGTLKGTYDNYIAKLDSSGTNLVYSTYWGGASGNDDGAFGIAVDDNGNSYTVGETRASDFPLINATQSTMTSYEGFIVRLSPSGEALYSTYVGGANYDYLYGVAVNGEGNAVAAGDSNSATYPIVGSPYQDTKTGTYSGVITIISPLNLPSASFTADPLSGDAPLEVRFTDTSTGDPTSWSWAFGDSGTSDEQNPVHTYTSAGLFTVNLTVTNAGGSDSFVRTDYITVALPEGAGLASSAWPKFQFDTRNTGQSPNAGPETGTLYWTFPANGEFIAQPSIGPDGSIYIENYDGDLYAVNPDGTLKWNYTLGEQLHGSPAISADGTIYVGNRGISAINPDGTLKWTYPEGPAGNFTSATIGPDKTIYVGSFDGPVGSLVGSLYAISDVGDRATLKWAYNTGPVLGVPAIGNDGTIYAGSLDKDLYAIRPDGTLKWNFTTGGQMELASPAIGSDGTIYIANNDTNLYAVDPMGSLRWTYAIGNYVLGTLAIGSDGTIYIVCEDRNLHAINPNGTARWSFDIGGSGAPVLAADGTVYIGSDDGNIYAINPEGTLKWSFATGSSIVYSAPCIGEDGTLYVGNFDGDLIALKDIPAPVPLPGKTDPPTDPDGDGIIEDMNANGIKDFNDVFLFFRQMEWIQANEPVPLFDFNGNGIVDFNDIVRLFKEL